MNLPSPIANNFPVNEEINRCVKCGLCLPECPTYSLTLNESESPRGRITIIAALLEGQLPADVADNYLDKCLLCRRCEKVCPSEVRFGKLMDFARGRTLARRPKKLRYLVEIISKPRLLASATRLAHLAPRMGGNHSLSQLVAYAGQRGRGGQEDPLLESHAAKGKMRGVVGLFAGCTGKALDSRTLSAAVKLLTLAGYEVRIPRAQTCCGALHAHLGEAGTAQQMEKENLAAFADPELAAIVSIASGCGAQLAGYQHLPAPHFEICSFLGREDRLSLLNFSPLKTTATVHIPCSQENVLDGGLIIHSLLERIPGLTILPAQNSPRCCGAAGIYFFAHPETAAKLRQPVADRVDQQLPEYLVSSNLGCALHIIQGLKHASPTLMHPVTLLAQQLIEE